MARQLADIHVVIGEIAKGYQYKTINAPDWFSVWCEKIRQFCGYWLSWLFAKLFKFFSGLNLPLHGTSDSGKLRIIIFLGALICGAVAIFIWQLKLRQKAKLPPINHADPGIMLIQPRTSSEWRQQAIGFKNKGLYREACRALHRACLQLFDELKLIDFVPARSNFEYMRALSNLQTLSDIQLRKNLNQTFQIFSNSVDRIYFGNHPAGEAEFELCSKWLQEIENYLDIKPI